MFFRAGRIIARLLFVARRPSLYLLPSRGDDEMTLSALVHEVLKACTVVGKGGKREACYDRRASFFFFEVSLNLGA